MADPVVPLVSPELPRWEQGEDGLLAALGIEGPCCQSCVEDSNEGYPTCYVYVNGERDEVEVCCAHVEPIERALAAVSFTPDQEKQ